MTTYRNNPGWEVIYVLEVEYLAAPAWSGLYPSLPEAHAALRTFETNHADRSVRKLTISEARIKKTPFLTVEP